MKTQVVRESGKSLSQMMLEKNQFRLAILSPRDLSAEKLIQDLLNSGILNKSKTLPILVKCLVMFLCNGWK